MYAEGSIEQWAHEYVTSTDLAHKIAPPPPPRTFAPHAERRRIARPGRPLELTVVARAPKRQRGAALVHTFWHHELQAAELMCWAILAFPDTPEAFRQGLLGVARDEIRHMALYAEHLATLGARPGSFPVRDWFWERIPSAPSPASFVATFGMGIEGGNLDHTARFAERFRAAGDLEGARLQERIGAEEVPHVRFARSWFSRFTGEEPASFESWRAHLPAPLSPILMRGAPIDRRARIEAGMTSAFIDELEAWRAPGS